ncbi:flagellar basal body P-ring formation chaperone FlgA [Roseobacter sp. HKCCA0434]|uniref:flagellar basal body P-ring formation chaperone FlgA n=1 Tax=Roseobacter sp. HKCCA0434 TaxID=3079297 RepID=UPI002905AC59|nr:flagellar basal body P-ring formation chaperone FlgA [Roseobacter sp. HKCCA0434]
MIRAAVLMMLWANVVCAQSVQPLRAIRPEQVIGPQDVVAMADSWPGAVTAIDAVVGLEARVTLYPGRAILASDLVAEATVERNAVVMLTYRSGALSISAEGRALGDGRPGERIRAMNIASRTTVWGTVMPDGTLEVGQ